MAKEGFIDTGFVADRSVVDSLKSEGSILTPSVIFRYES
jgi:hypothetical protein